MREIIRRPAATLWLMLPFCAAAAVAQPSAQSADQTLKVGSLTLHSAAHRPGSGAERLPGRWILPGPLPAPWGVYFEYYPHSVPHHHRGPWWPPRAAPRPGYPATESRDGYLNLYQPLRAEHDVLIMDNRGTGRSASVDCPELQHASALTETNVAACGRLLGAKAPLYSGTLAGDDLAALLERSRLVESICTEIPMGRSSRRCSPCVTPTSCADWYSMAPIL